MVKFFLLLCICLLGPTTHAQDVRQEISETQKKKIEVLLKKKRLTKELTALEKVLHDFSLLYEEKKEQNAYREKEIAKNLPLLARLGRINPLRALIDPELAQNRLRKIILIRALTASLKRLMQRAQAELIEIKALSKDAESQSQLHRKFLQAIECQQNDLNLLADEKIKKWTKNELDRLAREEDVNILLDESRAILSKTKHTTSEAAAARGLPFHRLERPVAGNILENPALQNKFSPSSRGVVFETKKNAEVLAPSQGKVVFRGPLRMQGEILILDHGKKVQTIFMGMYKINAQVGENVYTGEKIGMMAGYGAEPPKLYLELRQKGKAIDPRPYFTN